MSEQEEKEKSAEERLFTITVRHVYEEKYHIHAISAQQAEYKLRTEDYDPYGSNSLDFKIESVDES